jgi:exodeoxyribonuclease-1
MAADAVSPAQLADPLGPEGRPTFRLEQLALANGVVHGSAHDALSDVLATVELCRLVHYKSPELWQRFVRFSNKATVADFVEAENGFVLTEFFGGQAYHSAVVCIGRDPDQANGRFCLALSEDLDRLVTMGDVELRNHLANKPCPIRHFRINAAPTLTALFEAPDHMLDGASIDDVEDRARRVKDDAVLCASLVEAYVASRDPYVISPHMEGRLYNSFPGPNDEARIRAFHDAAWLNRVEIVQSIEDERLRFFGLRHQALAETDRLLKAPLDSNGVLIWYRSYLESRRARVAEFRSRLFAA